MALLASIGDIHGNHKEFTKAIEFLLKKYSNIDGLILVGDIGANRLRLRNDNDNLTSYMLSYYKIFNIIREYFNERLPVFYVRGNHDLDTASYQELFNHKKYTNTYDLEFAKKTLIKNNETTVITGLGGAPYRTAKPYGWEDDAIREAIFYRKLKASDILVSHCPPYGFGDLTKDNQRCGSFALESAINLIKDDKRRVILNGHVHEDLGIRQKNNTIIINCGALEHKTDHKIVTFVDTVQHEYFQETYKRTEEE